MMRSGSKARQGRERNERLPGRGLIPIILAAGSSRRLGFPKALAKFGDRTALSIAIENCAGLGRPIVVLGHAARQILPTVPRGVRVVAHRGWQAGQLSSLRAGLKLVPRSSPFMLYPVDYPLVTRPLVRRLVAAFLRRRAGEEIVLLVNRRRRGHPVIFSHATRSEFTKAGSAREVVERDRVRVREVQVRTPAIWKDFDTPYAYRRRIFEWKCLSRL